MKPRTYMAVFAILLFLSCQKSSKTIPAQYNLSLTAPSGSVISTSVENLKSRAVTVLAGKSGLNYDLTITAITYLPVLRGYAATIHYRLADGQTGSYGLLSAENAQELRAAGAAFVEVEDPELSAAQYMLVCSGTCQCRAALAYNKTTSSLSYTCGCEDCTGTIYTL